MSGDIKAGEEEKVITPVEGALPGGFKTIKDMYETLEKTKAEAIENKTRKTDITNLQSEYDKLKAAEEKRLDSERTELEKAQAKITALEKEKATDADKLLKAQMNTLFERVLSGRLAGLDEPSQKLMRMHYGAAVKTSEGFGDEETLKSILDPVDELLKSMKTDDGKTVIMQSTPSGTREPAKFSDKVKELLSLNQGQIRELQAKKG